MDCMYATGSTDAFLAGLDAKKINSIRSLSFYGKSWMGENVPTKNLHDMRVRSCQPANVAEDPYILATLIAMAQEQHRKSQQRERNSSSDCCLRGGPRPILAETRPAAAEPAEAAPEAPASFEVRALLTTGERGPVRVFYVYRATISAAFLDKFESPSRYTPCDPIEVFSYQFLTKKPAKLVRLLPRALGLIDDEIQGTPEEQAQLMAMGMGYLERTRAWRESRKLKARGS
jgi:hypothetical protein